MAQDKSHPLTEELLESMREEVDAFFATHDQITSSVDYEEKVLEIARHFAAGLVTTGTGRLPKDRNSKKKS